MNRFSQIGQLITVIIIIYILEVAIGAIFLEDVIWLNKMNETIFSLIYSLTVIAFYYLISLTFKFFKIQNINEIIYLLISIRLISLVLEILNLTAFPIPPQMDFIINLTFFAVVIIFGIKVLRLNREKLNFILPLKGFVISLFISFLIIFTLLILNFIDIINIKTLTDENFTKLVRLIFVIPYTFGFIFFLKLNRNQQLTQK